MTRDTLNPVKFVDVWYNNENKGTQLKKAMTMLILVTSYSNTCSYISNTRQMKIERFLNDKIFNK